MKQPRTTTRHSIVETRLGELTLVGNGGLLTGVYFPRHWTQPSPETFGQRLDADDVLAGAAQQLRQYLAGERTAFDLPITLRGDQSDRRIWQLLTEIPYGETVTYGDLALRLQDGTTAQAVGQAVGRNPLSIVVPCHRVIGKNGKLTGYAGGLTRKQFLLDLEEPAESRAARLF
jgi:methylated-DNA-[protein]-cysteine S-methyltransferase